MAITESAQGAIPVRASTRRGGLASGPDRLTIVLLTLAGFLAVLALLAWQLRSTPARVASRPAIVLRRVYRTTIVETVVGSSGAHGRTGTSITQSGSSSGLASAPAAQPTTRAS